MEFRLLLRYWGLTALYVVLESFHGPSSSFLFGLRQHWIFLLLNVCVHSVHAVELHLPDSSSHVAANHWPPHCIVHMVSATSLLRFFFPATSVLWQVTVISSLKASVPPSNQPSALHTPEELTPSCQPTLQSECSGPGAWPRPLRSTDDDGSLSL